MFIFQCLCILKIYGLTNSFHDALIDLFNMKNFFQGKLEDGTEFDSSYPRGEPLTFTLGSGQVIKGWDQGLIG